MIKNCRDKDSVSYVNISIILGIIQVEEPKELKKKNKKIKQKRNKKNMAFFEPSLLPVILEKPKE